LAPGGWNITVYSYLDGELYAIGTKDVVLKLGQNNETIKMYEALSVTFDANGGSFKDGIEEVKEWVPKGGKVEQPSEPSHPENFYFVGWYKDVQGSEPFNFNTPITGSITLYAKWSTIPPLAGEVSITGTLEVGQTLTAVITGTLNGSGTVSYQWKSRNTDAEAFEDIEGAISETYKLTEAEAGKHIIVYVYQSDRSGSIYSMAVGPVQGQGTQETFTSIEDFRTWLGSQPDNIETVPYHVKLNVDSLDGDSSNTSPSVGNVLKTNANKYVKLDLSGSNLEQIEKMAFSQCFTLVGITIPDSVTTIGGNAFFNCTNLTGVTIGSGVSTISESAFSFCTSLTSVTIPASVTVIGASAFTACNLTSVTIPSSVTQIGNRAFEGSSLTSVTFATGNIKEGDFGNDAFPQTDPTNNNTIGGDNLRTAYLAAEGGAGTYIRSSGGDTWIKSVEIVVEMVWVPAGTFQMGQDGVNGATPVHKVTLTNGFYMGKYQVTQEQYKAVMGSNPSNFTAAVSGESGTPGKLPVEMVSWYDAIVFCNKLSMMEGLNPAYSINNSTNPATWGDVPTTSDSKWDAVEIVANSNGYRLPTEAQWEYAARGGNDPAYADYNYSGSNNDANSVAWYDYNSGNKTHEVGKNAPNNLGLYDMSGNVYEWCWDWFENYNNEDRTDPSGASAGTSRVVRGGCWGSSAGDLRSAYRFNNDPYSGSFYLGFRLVRP